MCRKQAALGLKLDVFFHQGKGSRTPPEVCHGGPNDIGYHLEVGEGWLGGTNLTSRADGDPENGQKVSLLACVASSETHIKIQFPKTALWGPYFIMFHCQQ